MARLTLKVSGEDLASPEYKFDMGKAGIVCDVIGALVEADHQIVCVMGGGNIVRGEKLAQNGFPNPVVADHIGMLATLQNGIFISESLEARNLSPRLMSKFNAASLAEPFSYRQAVSHLGKGSVVLIAGGTGNPGMTTDTAVVVAANELHSKDVIKTTKVDGVYSADPMQYPEVVKFDTLSYAQALADPNIKVMDQAALAFAEDKDLRTIICLPVANHILSLISGDTQHGSIITRRGAVLL